MTRENPIGLTELIEQVKADAIANALTKCLQFPPTSQRNGNSRSSTHL